MLDRRVASPLLSRWLPCTVDRFADGINAQLPRFNSGFPARNTEAIDAFTVSWENEVSWINPPWQLLDRVMYKLENEPRAAAVVLAPWWPRATWWPALQTLSVDSMPVHTPAHLSHLPGETLPNEAFVPGAILQQVEGVPEPLRNKGWRLAAFFIPQRH